MNPLRVAQRFAISASSMLETLGVVAFAGIVGLTVVDVVGAKLLNRPVPGFPELIGLLQVAAVGAGLAFSKVEGKQIYVGFLLDAAKGRTKAVLEMLCSILALGFWGAACWMLIEFAIDLVERGTGTALLGIPYYPAALWLAIGCSIPMCVLTALDIFDSATRMRRR